jgi:predicted TIM-barrel fold metal-dependent hydrolase
MKIIDTHQHLFDETMFTYNWLKDYPSLRGRRLMKEYLEATRELNIYKSVFVECDVEPRQEVEETRYILSLAEQENPLEGVVAGGRPEEPGFEAYLKQIVGHPKLKGVRRVLYAESDELVRNRTFVENIRMLEQYGLPFDLCVVPPQLPLTSELVRACPGVSFILDHCGAPRVKQKAFHPWAEDIKELSALPNLTCKISGLVAYADRQNWTADDLRPFVDHVIECFGWDRVMFGSDWPVCTVASTCKCWVDTLIDLTRNAGESNQRKFFQENAERIYHLN